MSTYLYAIITDGTDTFALADGTVSNSTSDATVKSWSPAVANLRSNALGGVGEFDDVVEDISIDIMASTAAGVWTAFAKLKRLLDRADAWRRSNGASGAAVLFKWSPIGGTTSSTGSPLQAPILARAEGDQTQFFRIPSDFPRSGNRYILKGVQLRFLRRGIWQHTTQSATHNTVTNGDLATLTFSAGQSVACPTKVDLSSFVPATLFYSGGYILFSEIANGISIVNAENMATGAYTSVSGSSQQARNTNVLRYTPGSASEVAAGGTSFSPPSTARNFLVYANMATNATGGVSYRVRAAIAGTNQQRYTNYVVVENSAEWLNSDAKWYCLGHVSIDEPAAGINLFITASAASAFSLDIDTLVILDVTNPAKVVSLPNTSEYLATPQTLSIDHRALTHPSPKVTFNSVGYTAYDSAYLSTSATVIYGIALLTGADTGKSIFRHSTSGAVRTHNWTATRTISYVTPA